MSTFTIDTGTSRATPSPVPGKRTTVPAIRSRKLSSNTGFATEQPIVMLTAYTMRMAQLLDAHCDMLLVGDSLAQVIYGLPSTIPVTMEMMCAHGAAVVRGSWHALVGVDMPFGSYEGSSEQAFANASRILKETGAAAVKLEGGEAMAPTIAFLASRGIPVIGHVGLTPQAVNVLGGYGARGREEQEALNFRGCARRRRRRRVLHCRRRRPRGDRDGRFSQRRAAGHRHRRIGAVRRAGAGNRRHARHVRADAALREALRRSCRPDRRGSRGLCRRGSRPHLPDIRSDLSREAIRLGSAAGMRLASGILRFGT